MLLDTAIGIFLKEGAAFLARHIQAASIHKKNLAQCFLAIYCELGEVQKYYNNFTENKRDENLYLIYDLNLRNLMEDIKKIETILSLNDNELYDSLKSYSDMSGPIDPGTAITRELRWHNISSADLHDTLRSIEHFIEKNFDTEDLIC